MLVRLEVDRVVRGPVLRFGVSMRTVKGFTPLCPTWAALDGDGLVFALLLWIPPEV